MSHIHVSIDDEHLDLMSSVVQALREHGMHIDQVLDGLGIVTGSVTEELRVTLESVPGVASVGDAELSYQLPTPHADLQ
jgi:methylmalonyl-CoA mutase cobalamin-binding subunit